MIDSLQCARMRGRSERQHPCYDYKGRPLWTVCHLYTEVCHKCVTSCDFTHTYTRTQTHAQRNESCWEVELRSIRLTTYLQTVGKAASLWLISERSLHFWLRAFAFHPIVELGGGRDAWMYGLVKGEDDGVWRERKTHMPAVQPQKQKPNG